MTKDAWARVSQMVSHPLSNVYFTVLKSMKHYKKVSVKGKKLDHHRYLMEQHLGRKLTRDEVVHHIDGDKHNNDLSNLEVMSLSEHSRMHMLGVNGRTISESTKDKLKVAGEVHRPKAKLTISQVEEIKARLSNGEIARTIAADYGVDRSAVSLIKTGKSYPWV